MAGVDASAMWELVSSLQGLNGNGSGGSTEQATCTRVDNDGTVWVRLLGAEIDTPVNGQRLADVVIGDNVTVTIEDGLLSVIGNSSRPSTSASHVEEVVGPVVQKVTEVVSVVADKASVGELQAATARIGELEADHVAVDDFTAVTGRIQSLESDHVSVDDFQAEQANIDTLQANTADIDTIRANSAKVQNLTAAQLEADHATIGTLDTTYATIANLNAANGRITNLESTKANISDLEANYITADEIEATYMHANMSNSDVAWIENGTIKNGAIVSAMINDVSANKLTAGTINGSVINVTNLNADNITTGTINGQRIGEGSLSLSKLDESVYTEAEVNNIVDGLNDRIDGAIETFTGTAVPTLNNSPASSWNTTKLRDEHVGDVYYVVNAQSQQNGYCYRFTKSGSSYSWQLIKDSDVTAALSRLTTAEGKITTFDSDISTLKTDTGTLTTRTTNLETRMSDAEDDILDKVDVTTFNEVSDTVDSHTQTISQHTTAISNKADNSTVTAVTNRVSKNEQDISGINTTIGQLQTTVASKADGSTVTTISNKLNTVSDTVDGHTQTITSVQNTLSTKADSSTVSTLTTKVNTVSDTVDGHTSQLTSITSTQTSMQSTLDKTVKSSIQLWYSKANTTAPGKPTSQVTSTSTSGGAWRIVVPAYNASYPNYYYCWQYEYTDGTYGWSAVVLDIAMGESQATARTADSNATAAATSATNAQNTANANIKSSVQLWFTKANSTAPNKPTSVVSTSNANTANAWNLVVPVWNSSYPHYFYCYQQQKGDGTYQWTDVVYDRATSEAQQLANTTSTNLSTLQEDYATYKQTTTENVSSIGTRLTTAEGKISTAESNITQNAQNIELKVSKDGVISSINQSAESVTIDASKINLVGAVTIGDLASATQDAVLNSNLTSDLDAKASKSDVAWAGTCDTAAGTAAKKVVCDGFTASELTMGATICVRFNAANTSSAALTLNVNGTGAKTIGVATGATSATNQLLWASGATIRFMYNTSTGQWRVADTTPTYYSTCSIAEGVAAKTAGCAGCVIFKGVAIHIVMTAANTNTSATLNVNSTGAKAIYYGNTTTRPTTANEYGWKAGATASFVFDGAYWRYADASAMYQSADAAKTASNYITTIDANNGIKIADASPSSATTYLQLASTFLDFIRGGVSMLKAWVDGTTAKVRVGAEQIDGTDTFNTLTDNEGIKLRRGTTVLSQFATNLIELGKNSYNATISLLNNGIEIYATDIDPDHRVHFGKITSGDSYLQFAPWSSTEGDESVYDAPAKFGVKHEFTSGRGYAIDDSVNIGGDGFVGLATAIVDSDDVPLAEAGMYASVDISAADIGSENSELGFYGGKVILYDGGGNEATYYGTFSMSDVANAIPVTLYDNASAAASATATLSETAANFKRLTIFFKDTDSNYSSVDVWSPNGKRVALSLTWINGASTQEMYQRVRWVTISGTSISTYKASSDSKYRTGQVKLGATASVANSDYLAIVHVIGYR